MNIFIDGAEGTTGLQLEQKLSALDGINLMKLGDDRRKDINARREYLNGSDAAFLCLPDAAAREAVSLVNNPKTVIIDASTAHRTAYGWAYGFPELSEEHYRAAAESNRISVPGCHASGFNALVYPLIKAGIVDRSERLTCTSLTGYSGGGKAMIADYENGDNPRRGARPYALGLTHKHLPEMRHVCGLEHPPIFQPIVTDVRQGMLVSVPLAKNAELIWETLNRHYGGNISVMPLNVCDALGMEEMNGNDGMEIFVFGGTNQTLLTARFDNLGKGAAGAAVQCLKIRRGIQ